MSLRQDFIDRNARRPYGKAAIKNYAQPKGHYRSFKIILGQLQLQPKDRYFELGCGGWVLLMMALETAASGAAIDRSEDMVALSKRNNRRDMAEGRLEVAKGDAAKLPWADNSFSAGASANVFFFVEQPEAALAEVHRVLKPGGRFSMVTVSDSLLSKITFGWIFSLRTYSHETMTSMLKAAGFSDVDVRRAFGIGQVCHAVKS